MKQYPTIEYARQWTMNKIAIITTNQGIYQLADGYYIKLVKETTQTAETVTSNYYYASSSDSNYWHSYKDEFEMFDSIRLVLGLALTDVQVAEMINKL